MCIWIHLSTSQWVNREFQSCFLARLTTTKSTLRFSARESFHSSRKSTAIIFNHFWPDLASTHYADATQQFLKDKGIWYIPKYNKPPAVASLRPIEDFWAAVKKENYNSEWEVEHFAQLKQRILAKARQILPETPPHSTWPNPEVRGKRIFGSPQMSIV